MSTAAKVHEFFCELGSADLHQELARNPEWPGVLNARQALRLWLLYREAEAFLAQAQSDGGATARLELAVQLLANEYRAEYGDAPPKGWRP